MGDIGFLEGADWMNPPPVAERGADGLRVQTGFETDFWRLTHYGFVHDNGHVLAREVPGDFTATLTWEAPYAAAFDQAGVMLWLDAAHWIKAGIELTDGATHWGCVVTRERSDWSAVAAPGISGPQSLRVTRVGGAVIVNYLTPGGHWQFLRLADFPEGPLKLGLMACSPSRAGFEVVFSRFTVEPAIANPLHPDSWDSVPGLARG